MASALPPGRDHRVRNVATWLLGLVSAVAVGAIGTALTSKVSAQLVLVPLTMAALCGPIFAWAWVPTARGLVAVIGVYALATVALSLALVVDSDEPAPEDEPAQAQQEAPGIPGFQDKASPESPYRIVGRRIEFITVRAVLPFDNVVWIFNRELQGGDFHPAGGPCRRSSKSGSTWECPAVFVGANRLLDRTPLTGRMYVLYARTVKPGDQQEVEQRSADSAAYDAAVLDERFPPIDAALVVRRVTPRPATVW